MNKVILIGHLGGDPDVRYSQSGSATTRISLATKERRKDRDGEWREYPEWHRLVFFGRLAEVAAEYLKKGKQISVIGHLRTNKYTDRDGIERRLTDIIADEMEMLGGKDDRQGGQSDGEPKQQRPATSARTANSGEAYRRVKEGQSAPPPPPQDDFDDDDIPF